MNVIQPIYIDKFNIYDIFHNENELIIITPYLTTPYTIHYISDRLLTFEMYACPHRHTFIYRLQVDYRQYIALMIDDYIIETPVHQYSSVKEIIFSTIVKEEDDFIIPWIKYHLRLGVSRFIIYDNSTNDTLKTVLEEYKDIVLLIKWTYPYITSISGISGQTTQQNHSIYAFRNSKYIGLFDIDEYVNLQHSTHLNDFFEQVILTEQIDLNQISSFVLLNKFFYNPEDLPVTNDQFLNIFNCDRITKKGHEKNFVIPKNVITFSVHMVTSGKPMYLIDETEAYFNHYCYLNKKRGKNHTNLIDDTIQKHLK